MQLNQDYQPVKSNCVDFTPKQHKRKKPTKEELQTVCIIMRKHKLTYSGALIFLREQKN
jgi:hypothetical protein